MEPMSHNLAINGGTPVRNTLLPYGRQLIGEDDISLVCEALTSGWLTTGPKVEEFEKAFASAVQAEYAVAVSNGTAALHAAAFAAGIGPGDEVIVPVITFAASANCVRYLGGNVVFVDVEPKTLNIDVTQVERAITPKTKAIIAVDFAGLPAELEKIIALAQTHRLRVIEDAAHAFGATYQRRAVGSVTELTTFSLHPVKHITTGEGGMITTSDPMLAQTMRRFRNHGINSDFRAREATASWFYEMVELGYNYRLTDIQCALGIAQLRKHSLWLKRRREIVACYHEALSCCDTIELPTELPNRESAWHLYPIRLNLELLTAGRAQIFQAFRKENIGVNVHYIPVPWHPYYEKLGYQKGAWPVGESVYERMLSLPLFPSMSEQDVADVIEACLKIMKAYRR